MASDVDICNLALAHLGDRATVASLDPPEGSAQAELCARFYPIARDGLLELYDWAFATVSAQPALRDVEAKPYRFAYAKPADALRIRAVLPEQMFTVYSDWVYNWRALISQQGRTVTGAYEMRADAMLGGELVLTNVENPTLIYTRITEDASVFPSLFVQALSYQLAAMLAGPILKGDVGTSENKRLLQVAQLMVARAKEADAAQRHESTEFLPQHLAGR